MHLTHFITLFIISWLFGCTAEQTEKKVIKTLCNISMAAIEDTVYHMAGKRVAGSEKQVQERPVTWSAFFDTSTINNIGLLPCNTRRGSNACVVDSFELFASDKGVYIEYGQRATFYWLYKDFPVTPTGIKSGDTKEQVKAVLGTPRNERDNQMQYSTGGEYGNPVVLHFKDNKLHIISHAISTGDCME